MTSPTLNCSGVTYDPNEGDHDCIYDPAVAERAVGFFRECLKHTKGPTAGKPFDLEPWQADATRVLFGWLRPDGTRRYRQSYITVPRKNGKTTWAAGLALYMLFADGEAGAQCYCAATDREQASLAFSTASQMTRKNATLDAACRINESQRRIIYGDSFLRAIPANEEAAHGFDIHCLVGDELHAWYGRKMYDVLLTGMGARPQPLALFITTAGHDRHSICWKEYSYARGVRDGKVDDPYYLPVIYEAEEHDDWQDPDVWTKANPNFGISLRKDYIERECKRAAEESSYENTFRRLHLNQWTSQKTRWLKIEHWRACQTTTEPIPSGTTVWGGLDLASTTDLTAWCLVARQPDGGFKAQWKFWIPEERMHLVEKQDRVPYSQWAKQGLVDVIPGSRIDQDVIEKQILADADRYHLQFAGYDPWNAEGLTVRLDAAGVPCVKMRQGHATLSSPSKELEACVIAGTLDHGGNPVAEWMAENVEVITDTNGNIKPVRPEHNASGKKIDGIVALIMAMGVALTAPEKRRSVYESRGPIMV